jgi:hypothetical protein
MPRKSITGQRIDEWEEYRRALGQAAQPFIVEIQGNKLKQEVLQSRIRSLLFDEPQQVKPSELRSSQEESLLKLLSGFIEIRNTFDVLIDIPMYLQKPFPKGRKLSKLRYLKYHVTNYFNEVYILRERVKSYRTIVVRLSKKLQRILDSHTMSRIDQIIAAFDRLVDLRGKHVHKERYTDGDIKRLDFFEMMFDNKFAMLEEMFDSQAQKSKSEWIGILKSSNSSIEQLLNAFFREIYKLTFNESGEWLGFAQWKSST